MTKSRSLRHSANRPWAKPVRLIDDRYCFGMIWSVSTLARSSGTTSPFRTVNFSIVSTPPADIDEVPGDRRRGRHRGTDEVGASAGALAALEVSVRGRSAALAGVEPIRVHAQAHRAPRLAPLEAGFAEDPVEPFALGLLLHHPRSRHDQR